MTTDAIEFSLFGLLLTAIPAAFFIYLSRVLQKLNSAQIERLFDLDEEEVTFRGIRISLIFTAIQFLAVLAESIFIISIFIFLQQAGEYWIAVLQFCLIFIPFEILSRQILPTTFPLHIRESLNRWERLILISCGYVFYVPALMIDRTLGIAQKFFRSKSKDERMTRAEETIRSIIDAGERDGVFLSDEGEMLQSIVELSETIVREVMTPRIDLQAIEINASIDDFVAKIVETGYSKIPVFKEKVDDIVGILYAKDVLPYWKSNGIEVTLDELKRDVTFVPETKKVSILLREFQREKKHLTIVVDEFGGVAGLVTIEDLLEEIVGEIHDEYDEEEQTIQQLSETSWEVAARIDLDELSEEIDVEFPDDNYETLGGFLFHLFGRIPLSGESHAYENMLFKITKANERRIETVLITKEETKLGTIKKESPGKDD